MQRSFTNRVFGGVCGGLGELVRVNPWWFRGLFALLSLITLGVFGVVYLLLWWLLPQESLMSQRRRGGAGSLLLLIVIVVAALAGWIARLTGSLVGPNGQDLLWPVLLVALSLVFALRQLRG
jgi:phage shock protein PspC (stress-responsive transcriptional regulator)